VIRARTQAPEIEVPVLVELWTTVVEDWALDPTEALELLGCRRMGKPRRDGEADDVRRLELITEFAPVAADVLGSSDAVRTWLREPNLHLRGATPIQCMADDPAWLRFLIDNLDRICSHGDVEPTK